MSSQVEYREIDEVIADLECCNGGFLDDALYYLKEYRDCRKLLKTENIISYWGKLPVVKIKDHYYAVRDYIPDKQAWRCHRLRWSDISCQWSCDDDDNYIIDNNRNILFIETGWDRRRIPYESI